MRGTRIVGLVLRREIRERSRTRGFLISTAVLLIGVVGLIAIPRLVGEDQLTFRMGVVGAPSPAVRSAVAASARPLGAEVEVRRFDRLDGAHAALRREELEIVVDDASLTVRGEGTSDDVRGFALVLAGAIPLRTGLEGSGIDTARVEELLDPRPLVVEDLVPPSPEAERARGAIFLGSLILYGALITYGSWVGLGILEEKSTRVVEVIVSAIRPSELLAGKVLGIGLLGLGQLVVVGAVALVASTAVGGGPPPVNPATVAMLVVCFALGFALYSCAFAAAGAAAARQEDGQAAIGPLNILIIVAYFASTVVQGDPDGTLARVSSFIPPLAPLTLPARVLLGSPPAWEPVVAVTLIILATYGLVWLGARAYGGAVLRFGSKVRLREALRPGPRSGRPLPL